MQAERRSQVQLDYAEQPPKVHYMKATASSAFARQALLAQLVEQLTLNQWVQGSSP